MHQLKSVDARQRRDVENHLLQAGSLGQPEWSLLGCWAAALLGCWWPCRLPPPLPPVGPGCCAVRAAGSAVRWPLAAVRCPLLRGAAAAVEEETRVRAVPSAIRLVQGPMAWIPVSRRFL